MTTALRVITLLLAGCAIGLTAAVGYLYVKVHRYQPPSAVPTYFVPAIALAHILLTVAVIAEIVRHVAVHEAFTWWLTPFALPAFCLTIYALLTMMFSPHLQKVSADVEAHIQAKADTSGR